MVRLDALISEVLGCTKKEGQRIVEAGDVAIAGRVKLEHRWQVVLGEEVDVTLKGKPLLAIGPGRPFPHRLYMLNKPQRCLCERFRGSSAWVAARGIDRSNDAATLTAKEVAARERGCISIYDLVPSEHQHPELGVFGRLDVDTTGFIILGTDGGLQSLFMHPSCGCEKAYLATLRTESYYRLRDSAAEEFAAGLTLADGHACRPAKLEVVETVDDPAGRSGQPPFPRMVRVTMQEGQYHQVKRMLGHVGGAVCALHRERVGGLSLADYPHLAEGQMLPMGEKELEILRTMLPMNRVAESGKERKPRVTRTVGPPPVAVAYEQAAAPPPVAVAYEQVGPPPPVAVAYEQVGPPPPVAMAYEQAAAPPPGHVVQAPELETVSSSAHGKEERRSPPVPHQIELLPLEESEVGKPLSPAVSEC